tara:strand:+ start:12424 stop:13398 length:975 start_codon:yes stop_codon:yes gene_type:complete
MLLEVEDLSITFDTAKGPLQATRQVSFKLAQGETLGIVGESGCGKSITNLAIMGLLPDTATVSAKKLHFDGADLQSLSDREFRKIRGAKIGMIFQDPMSALNPSFTVGFQIDETLREHCPEMDKAARAARALELMNQVGIPAPAERLKNYAHELSGGMSQRVMIAMAIACKPKLLIADEPTTALDVTIQAQIMKLLKDLQKEYQMAMILVTHDLGVVAQNADRIQVMYAGEVVESAKSKELLAAPAHPYTDGLLSSLPGKKATAFRQPLPSIAGMVPDLRARPKGCQFNPRCLKVEDKCKVELPVLTHEQDRQLRCFYPVEGAV